MVINGVHLALVLAALTSAPSGAIAEDESVPVLKSRAWAEFSKDFIVESVHRPTRLGIEQACDQAFTSSPSEPQSVRVKRCLEGAIRSVDSEGKVFTGAEYEQMRVSLKPAEPRAAIRVQGIAVGYLHIPVLVSDTPERLLSEFMMLERNADPMIALILDLRGCPGGLLTAVRSTASLFLKRGTPVMEYRGPASYASGVELSELPKRLASPTADQSAALARLRSLPILILIDRDTAGAAEAFVTALVRNTSARTIGEATKGRDALTTYRQVGRAQYVASYQTAVLFGPLGISWRGTGIQPDIAVSRSESGPLPPAGSADDPFISRAVDHLKLGQAAGTQPIRR